MHIVRYIAISAVSLFLLSGIASAADKPSKKSDPATPQAATPSQSSPVQKPPSLPKPQIVSLPSKVTVSDVTIIYCSGIAGTVTITLKDPNGTPLVGKTVRYCPYEGPEATQIGGAGCGTPVNTGPGGIGTYSLVYGQYRSPNVGTYPAIAYFQGDDTAPPGVAIGKIIVQKGPTVIVDRHYTNERYMGSSFNLVGRLKVNSGWALSGKPINVYLNGTLYKVVTTYDEQRDSLGYVKGGAFAFHYDIPVTPNPMSHNFVLSFPGDENLLPNTDNFSYSFTSIPRP
jgi:hypothetical protein